MRFDFKRNHCWEIAETSFYWKQTINTHLFFNLVNSNLLIIHFFQCSDIWRQTNWFLWLSDSSLIKIPNLSKHSHCRLFIDTQLRQVVTSLMYSMEYTRIIELINMQYTIDFIRLCAVLTNRRRRLQKYNIYLLGKIILKILIYLFPFLYLMKIHPPRYFLVR